MTSNEELIREVLTKALPGGLSHLAIMGATTDLLKRFDITEKPEPEAPIGTVRVRRSDYEPEGTSIYIKVGAYRWVGVYTGEAYSKGVYVNDHLHGGEWGDTEVFRP
ncbi:helix-turn-helix DNA binding domain protein [Mycobacterium phage McGuire]|nr:helix-turn-helix DNA binding domain protein [Mycobacterium phage McGuire]